MLPWVWIWTPALRSPRSRSSVWSSGRQTLALVLIALAPVGCGGSEGERPPPPEDAGGHDHDAHTQPPIQIDQDASVVPVDGSIVGQFAWQLPQGWPVPVVPAGNPMS